MSPVLDGLVTEVRGLADLVPSAVALLNGIQTRITDAVTKALANGATAEELAPLTDLATEVGQKKTALAEAIFAGTPAEPMSKKK